MLQTYISGEKKEKRCHESVIKLIIWCAPTLILLLIIVFWSGIIPSQSSDLLIVIIALMGLIITRIIFLLRSPKKAATKAALILVWIVIFVVVGFFGLLLGRTIHHVIKTDAQSRFEADIPHYFLESVSAPIEVGSPKTTEYHTYSRSFSIFYSDSWILSCWYNEEEYTKTVTSIEEHFRFRTEPLGTGYYDENHIEIVDDPYTMIGDELFRMLVPGDGDISDFYKSCFLIMTNDKNHQIAYIAFSDEDLDMIESLEDLINDYCGWKYLQL